MDKSFVKEMEVALLEKKRKRLEAELSSIGKETGKVIDDFDANFPDYGDKEDENAAGWQLFLIVYRSKNFRKENARCTACFR